ncbi:hypothetical protein HHK36_032238 [Tetracentron sinense]|uniref:C2 domain-containing protein n=1 Tax=Tetracentron sinense TaxID=13715 RepID=A0A834Y9K9_TETSI|nr:hypothetical protein HHK36_032238 [Tetracentron sinense]
MAENCSRKLVVEICNAKNLMPKDGQGTSCAYVLVDFDGQRRRTKTKFRDLNPQWDEKLEFLIHDPESMASEILEVNVYNDKKTGKRSTFLGKVKISGSSFAKSGSETLIYYPLEKRSVFSQIKGEIGLKICYIDEDPPAADAAAPDQKSEAPPPPSEEGKRRKKKRKRKKRKQRRTRRMKNQQRQKKKRNRRRLRRSLLRRILWRVLRSLMMRSQSSRYRSTYDLVDRMPFLYVRILKANRANSDTGSSIFAKLVIGTHSIRTKSVTDKDWDQVFAFDKEGLNSTALEVSVWMEKKDTETDTSTDTSLGNVSFDLQEVPKRVPPDSPLAPQWYTLEGSPENMSGTDVMLAVWIGAQADEAFQEAWQSDSGGLIPETRAKVYLSPKLWYIRLTVIQTQDLQLGSAPEPKTRGPELYVKAQLGAQLFKTGRSAISSSNSANPTWNEDLVFVAAEPFEPLRIHVRVCLEGGYHVLDEAAHVTSDVRAAAKQLAKPPIGLLEIGIRGATNLLPVKTKDGTRGTTDAYVVAKYGPKWIRTRTILDRFKSTLARAVHVGRIRSMYCTHHRRIRQWEIQARRSRKTRKRRTYWEITRYAYSTMDINRVPVLKSIHPRGIAPGAVQKKLWVQIELAVRFSVDLSWMNHRLQAYTSTSCPECHYGRPLGRPNRALSKACRYAFSHS